MVVKALPGFQVILLVALELLPCSTSYAQSFAMPANQSVTLNICDSAASAPIYFHYNLYTNGYLAQVNGAGYVFNPNYGVDTPDLPLGQTCQQFVVHTSGIAAGTSDASFQVHGCHDYPPPGGKACDGGLRIYNLLTAVTPSLSASPVSITAEGVNAETITITQASAAIGAGTPVAGVTVTASCATQNGAQASVSPTSVVTDANGKASFQVTASGLRYAASQPQPNGSCTFTSSGSVHNATVSIQGTIIGSTYTVTPKAGANGSISPSSPQPVNYAQRIDFAVSANPGYAIADVSGCGGALNGTTYTTGPISGDCTVTATFAASVQQPINLDQHGLTGAWYNPATGGQGFLISVYKDLGGSGTGVIALGWYTFDVSAAGGQRWYTLQGSANSGDVSAALTIYSATGGNFNAPPKVSAARVGTATLSFSSCTTGTLVFNFDDGRSGAIPLTRLDPNITCSPAGDTGNATQNPLSGAWYDQAASGQGFVFEVNPSINLMFAAWYTYAPNGSTIGGGASQRWYTIQDNAFVPGTISKGGLNIYETTGGAFNTGKVSAGVPVGTASFTINSCSSLTLTYNFTSGSNAGQTGSISLGRIVNDPAGCAP